MSAAKQVGGPGHERALLDAALSYGRRGWSVVPMHAPLDGGCTCRRDACPSPGKHPRVRWEAFTRRCATAEELTAWWGRWPDANVGLVTGLVSGVVVLDVDPRNGGEESLDGIELRWGELPPTLEVQTGGGGRHLWLAATEPLPTAPLAPGLELKGEGGVIVVPPSLHVSGRRYTWVAGRSPGNAQPTRAPAWVVALAVGTAAAGLSQPLGDPPPRTSTERAEFAAAWARAGIELRPGDHTYLCPFHPDHRPSLHVDSEGCRWFCFGCRRGGGIGALARALGEDRPSTPRGRLRRSVGAATRVTLAGEERTEVVGESGHQDVLLALSGGRRPYGGVELEAVAELVPGPGGYGVDVLIDGATVGRLRPEDAASMRLLLEDVWGRGDRATCRALVRGGWDRGRDDIGMFGVVLLLP